MPAMQSLALLVGLLAPLIWLPPQPVWSLAGAQDEEKDDE
jgi:hypothetical protein